MDVQNPDAHERLAFDYEFYARQCLKVVGPDGHLVKMEPRPGQLKLYRKLEEQRLANKPQRAYILKARQIGFCLAPETRVLTADLRWLPIESLESGQEIVATDENIPGGRGKGRKMRRAVIEAKAEVFEPAFRITMSNGEALVATAPHRFLARKRSATDTTWRTVADTRVGDVIRFVAKPWGEQTIEDSWVAGMIDGEGCMRRKPKGGCELTISQCPGPVLDRLRSHMETSGLVFHEERSDRSALGRKDNHKIVVHRTNELFELIGRTRPTRFVDNGYWWENTDLPGKRSGQAWATVTKIEPLGPQRMIDLQTSAKTFIAEGFVSHNSTLAQGILWQRTTTRAYHRAIVVAHNSRSAAELFDIGKRMYNNLPASPKLGLKPQIASESNTREKKYLKFGETARERQRVGDAGLDSSLEIDTAKELDTGRGFTYRSMHLSEVAFWRDLNKMLALLNSVPDEPDTLVLVESTANGFNGFKEEWDRAEAGESDYAAVFVAWWEEPRYSLAFDNKHEREEFIERKMFRGVYGEDEERLVELFNLTPEQLHWRRNTIANKCRGKVELFNQEYPTTALDAFISSGKTVFSKLGISRAVIRAEQYDPREPTDECPGPELGVFRAAEMVKKLDRKMDPIEVPSKALWVPKAATGFPDSHDWWRLFEQPKKAAQYIITVDPAGAPEEDGSNANHGVTILDHKAREQVGEHESQIDPHILGFDVFLAALHYNNALIVVEVTGGYGLSIVRTILLDYKYPWVYYRKSLESGKNKEKMGDRLGWETRRASKALIEDGMTELLDEESAAGIRSARLAKQLHTHVQQPSGKTGPEKSARNDLLMSWMIGQQVAQERPMRAVGIGVVDTRVKRKVGR